MKLDEITLREPGALPDLRSRDEEERAALLSMIGQMLAQPPRRGPDESAATPTQGSTPTAGWHPGDGSLTLHSGATAGVDGGGGDGSLPDRLVAALQTNEFGEVRITVDRSSSGLDVVLAIENGQGAATAAAQQGALLAALRAVGVRIGSVSVRASGGTELAQSELAEVNTRPRLDILEGGGRSATTRARSAGRRKLDTLG
jgi:hypothetical protein